MSALDDAIAAHAAHSAGACTDPLTDSLAEQCLPGVPMRAGWEHEVPVPPLHKGWAISVVLVTILVCWLLSGCGGGDEPCRDDFTGPPAPGFEDLPLCEDPGRARVPTPACLADPRRCT
jgi:hypothetical protein